ncbi:MAG: hypothetical protein RLZZ618_1631 [Pseudomonadota bacterium]|jgi:hypothetical protein
MLLRSVLTVSVLATSLLAGCDLFGDSAEKLAAARDADGRAIGGACRHANRAIEDCYALNKKADKAAVFAGWRDMNDYMRENKIEPVSPQVTPPPAGKPAKGEKAEKPEKADKPEMRASEAKPEAKADVAPGETVVPVERKPAKATAKPAQE